MHKTNSWVGKRKRPVRDSLDSNPPDTPKSRTKTGQEHPVEREEEDVEMADGTAKTAKDRRGRKKAPKSAEFVADSEDEVSCQGYAQIESNT